MLNPLTYIKIGLLELFDLHQNLLPKGTDLYDVKYGILISIALVLTACNKVDSRVLGTWRTNSDFYSAKYFIHIENDSVKGEVLSYNDGTMVFKKSDSARKFLFTQLIKEGDTYVDAVSGATKTENPKMWSIHIKSDDTLLIGQQIGKQTRTEIWTRIKE